MGKSFFNKDNANYRHGHCCKGIVHVCRMFSCLNKVSRYNNKCKSCASKGKKHSFQTKNKIRISNGFGPNHHSYKKNARIHRQNYCLDCRIKVHYNTIKGRCASCEGKRKHRLGIINIKGKNNGRYIHGKGNEPYPNDWNVSLKETIRKRDNYRCQCCGMSAKKHLKIFNKKINVHHIDYDKKNLKELNLITVCQTDNIRANTNRDYWYAYYTYKMENYDDATRKN